MAGFFGLFSRKNKSDVVKQSSEKPKDAFFLEPDEAKTLGDIEYMKKPIIIRRTFAKTAASGDIGESIKSISSLESKVLNPKELEGKKAETPVFSQEAQPSPKNERKASSDDGLDSFRKMARDINKK